MIMDRNLVIIYLMSTAGLSAILRGDEWNSQPKELGDGLDFLQFCISFSRRIVQE